MKKIFHTLWLVFLFLNSAIAQDDLTIGFENTKINVPDVYDFGEVTELTYQKYIIQNNRQTTLEIKNISVPTGFFANISETEIAPGKKAVLYIGLDPAWTELSGDFSVKITIKTNLIMPAVVEIKGKIIKE